MKRQLLSLSLGMARLFAALLEHALAIPLIVF
jgi:hypothetical protein